MQDPNEIPAGVSDADLNATFETLTRELEQSAARISGSPDGAEEFRLEWVGRKQGRLKTLSEVLLKSAPPEARKSIGQRFNILKTRVEELLASAAGGAVVIDPADALDVTLPGTRHQQGAEHPLIKTMHEVVAVFQAMGYSVGVGPEVETDYYNFESLNFPPNHPARDTQDTLVIAGQERKPLRDRLLMRTHTSPVQIRTMEMQPPPVRIVIPGKVHRNDASDATHSPIFHQVEGLCVDTNITFSDLKGTLDHAMKALFGSSVKTRFFPSFFPFTEPSADVQISCPFCGGKGCRKCKHSGWIELLGCGMVDPAVFGFVAEKQPNYDPKKISGFAFGMGVDRIAMMKYGISDIGQFYSGDVRFLEQFCMKILTQWLRDYLPGLAVSDRELADDLTLRGIAVEGVFDLGANNGSLYETDITTNRVDAMNHYGVAREAAAIYGLTLPPLYSDLSSRPAQSGVEGPALPITIEAPDLCGRFTARILRDVRIQPSSGVVANRFRLLEQKQISNAVDATNYVLQAMGQPTHAFDLDKLEGGIVVRRARKGERLRLLDATERILDADDLVVADERKALGLAGVMGGWDSMITAETKNILVEAAWFDPSSVRRTSRRHGIHTDASHRFERGADFNAPPVGSAMVCEIILQSGGHIASELIDIVMPAAEARTAKRPPIQLSVSEVQRLLGATVDGKGVDAETTEQVLSALGCKLTGNAQGEYSVTLPSWRLDLEREIDLVEEVARVYGYNRFANTLPVFSGTVIELPHATRESNLRTRMLANGFHEALTSTFCSAADAGLFAQQPGVAVAMGNPLNTEAGMLRPSLLPGLVTAIELNVNRNVEDVRIFEIGTAFSGSTDRVDERPALGFAATGATPASGPHTVSRAFDFYDAKGIVESLLDTFQYRSAYFDALLLPAWLHPGRGARCVADGLTVGYFGQLHPVEAQKRKLKQPVFAAALYLDRLYALPLRQPRVQELSRFQPVSRDFSFTFPDAVHWEQIESSLHSLSLQDTMTFAPRELFRPRDSADKGKYSLLLSTTFQAPDRTLKEDEVQAWSKQVMDALEQLGGLLRK